MSTLWRSFFDGLGTILRTDPVACLVLFGGLLTTSFYLAGGAL